SPSIRPAIIRPDIHHSGPSNQRTKSAGCWRGKPTLSSSPLLFSLFAFFAAAFFAFLLASSFFFALLAFPFFCWFSTYAMRMALRTLHVVHVQVGSGMLRAAKRDAVARDAVCVQVWVLRVA
ncbi:uncharacterized protein K452DRAFT_341262, partial [Aplosporella prunicola CBS 121167]